MLTRAGCIKGAKEILPLCTFVFVLAATFGAAARQAGLSIPLASLMSAAVFAGAQFAALALLGPPPSIMPILLGTLAINARHLLLGAALAPWLLRLPRWQRLCAVTVLSDANRDGCQRRVRPHVESLKLISLVRGVSNLVKFLVRSQDRFFERSGAGSTQTLTFGRRSVRLSRTKEAPCASH